VTAGSTNLSGTTALDGRVTISGVPAGSVVVEASKDLYVTASVPVTVVRDQTTSAPVTLARRVGRVAAQVQDEFGARVPNALVQASIEGRTFPGTTSANGTVELLDVPTGGVSISTTAAGFQPSGVSVVTVSENQAAPYQAALRRIAQASGGLLSARPTLNGISADGRTLQFSVQVVIVDVNSNAISTLTPAQFNLLDCVDADTQVRNCIRGNAVDSYSVVSRPSSDWAQVPGGTAVPYAAAIAIDQSDSITVSDPTDARIFSSKTFLSSIGVNDNVVLAAFAVSNPNATPVQIPTQPVTIYGPFTNDGRRFFGDLDFLATAEGGGTPLYRTLDSLITYTKTNAPIVDPNTRRAVVLFTDGQDTDTVCPDKLLCRENSIALSAANAVDIFTIGLSDDIDFEAMADLADRGNGAFLFAENAEQLLPIYGSLGKLLSRSLLTYRMTWQIQATQNGAFVPGNTVLGRLNVDTGTNQIVLPIAVRIF
jgi:hypothetical protein